MEKQISVCNHCGSKTTNPAKICSHCYEKRKLIRVIQGMLRPYFEAKHRNDVSHTYDGKEDKFDELD